MKHIILICILEFITCISIAQSRWVRIYHDEVDAPIQYILESYDRGYILSGKIEANYSKYNWILKTDINGEILWEKTIGNGVNAIFLPEMGMNENGDTYVCGGSRHEDPYGDPVLMKLNACGEKEWCKDFYSPDQDDFAKCICITPDGGCAITLDYTGLTLWDDRICLAKFSPGGIMEWKQCYNSQDSLLGNEEEENLILTPDHGFLISGWCYYTDTTGTLAWVHPYYIKTDSVGNFEWELVFGKESGATGGQAWQTIISPNGKYYLSSISHYYYTYTSSPALLKMDLQGTVINSYDLKTGYIDGKVFNSAFLNDSLIACGAGWGNTDDDFVSMALIVDTLGKIIDSSLLHRDIYLSHVRKTFDGKLLFYNQTHLSGEFDVFLFKFNQGLEDDTLYSFPYNYDSLCSHQIVSDTIGFDDCELIVGIEEEEQGSGDAGKQGGMEVWPNPASEVVRFVLESQQKVGQLDSWQLDKLSIEIYDIFGRIVQEINVRDGQNEVQINVEVYPPGIYLGLLKGEQNIRAGVKFVIAR
jgi:hypothetical protein